MSKASEFSAPLVKGLKAAGVAFENDRGQLKIPARHADVGDLLITFETVGSRCSSEILHITTSLHARGAKNCVEDALDYIWGILNDQRVLWSYRGDAGGSYRLGAEDDRWKTHLCRVRM